MYHRSRLLILFCLCLLGPFARANPAPTALPPATQGRIRDLLAKPEVASGHIGLVVIGLGTSAAPASFATQPYDRGVEPVLLEIDGGKRYMPASNLKLYTAAIALRGLGANHVFTTRILGRGRRAASVAELLLTGGGDPSLGPADLDALAARVASRGIRRYGSLAVDNSLFRAETFGGRYPDGWTLDDTIWYYGPEVSALAINRNQVDVIVEGAATPGRAATVVMSPVCRQIQIESHVTTAAQPTGAETLHFEREETNGGLSCRIVITGTVAPGERHLEGLAVPAPAAWAADLLRRALARHGVMPGNGPPASAATTIAAGYELIAAHPSPPLAELLRRLLKNSDNLYAEMLLRAAGLDSPPRRGADTAAAAHTRLRAWLQASGIAAGDLRFMDGSGLSRYNLVTPLATARLLAAISRVDGAESFWDALPIAGVDGTLKDRMRGTRAAGNARAKTGTFSIASALSGYVTTRDGHRLAVALLTNFVPTPAARTLQDEIYTVLADTSWAPGYMAMPATPTANLDSETH